MTHADSDRLPWISQHVRRCVRRRDAQQVADEGVQLQLSPGCSRRRQSLSYAPMTEEHTGSATAWLCQKAPATGKKVRGTRRERCGERERGRTSWATSSSFDWWFLPFFCFDGALDRLLRCSASTKPPAAVSGHLEGGHQKPKKPIFGAKYALPGRCPRRSGKTKTRNFTHLLLFYPAWPRAGHCSKLRVLVRAGRRGERRRGKGEGASAASPLLLFSALL